jgi:hypothetical protein
MVIMMKVLQQIPLRTPQYNWCLELEILQRQKVAIYINGAVIIALLEPELVHVAGAWSSEVGSENNYSHCIVLH